MQPKEKIYQSIKKAVGALNLKSVDFVVEHPAQETHGDYATNVAMVVGGNPRESAAMIVEELKKDEELGGLVNLERIEIAGPGFINFWLKKDWLIEELKGIDSSFGKGTWGEGKKALVEYSSPNIAKRFSVGHFRSTIIGQAVRNLYEFSGWETVGDNHLGDWGTQFGMMIAAIEEKGLDISVMSVEEMEELYVEYNKKVKEDEKALEKARDAFAGLESGEVKAREIWKVAVDKSMEEFDEIYKLLGVKIENAYGESAYEELMAEVIEEAKAKGVVRESEGALIVEFDDLPPAMLLKSNKTTTYFTRDLATIKFRNQSPELKSDLYIYEVGAEQTLHFQQVFAAAVKLGYGKKEDFKHVTHGLILGKDGKKMSTRKGTTVKIEEWLKELIAKASSINEDSAQIVGIGGVKYFDLKHDPNTAYKFDWEQALKLDGDSAPYLQYAIVRAKSVLKDGGDIGEFVDVVLNEEEMAVLRWIYRFPEVVELSARDFSPNILCSYLFVLASRFNAFYNKHRVLESKQKDFRLMLTKASSQVLETGLLLLGIQTPERM